MRYKLSKNFALQTPRFQEAAEFYSQKLGTAHSVSDPESLLIHDREVFFYFDKGATKDGPIFELLTEDLDAAKSDLISSGCEIVRWGGKGHANYVRDPFGFIFNVYEDPDAFSS